MRVFSCVEFGKDTSFVFSNWKKSAKLAKHGKSENHVRSMTRWLQFKAMQRNKTSLLQQLNTAHQDQVVSNRQFLKVIIQSLMYTAQQNVAISGHEENRNNTWEVSDINRGNFLELLCIRCNDLPWLRSKLQSQLQLHAQWTSPAIQNELLEIVANIMLDRIAAEARSSDYYGIVVDETADIVTAKKSADDVIKTLSGCRTLENFDLLWSCAITMADEMKELIDGTDFNFKDANVPRLQQPSRRLQEIVGEIPEVNAKGEYRAAEDHYRITCYYLSIDKIVAELKYRFEGNDQEHLLALADIVFNSSPTRANIELVSDFYGIDSELFCSEKNVFENIDADYPDPERKNVAKIVRRMFDDGVHEVLPVV